jgi:hypothetical protein
MPGARGMILAVLLTLMTGKVYDATPTRDGNHVQESEDEGATPSGTVVTHTTPVSETAPYMCQV